MAVKQNTHPVIIDGEEKRFNRETLMKLDKKEANRYIYVGFAINKAQYPCYYYLRKG